MLKIITTIMLLVVSCYGLSAMEENQPKIFHPIALYPRATDTPLHEAAEKGDLESVRALILSGAHVDARGRYFQTPLSDAAMRGRKDVVQELVASGADVNTEDFSGECPLHHAVACKSRDVVLALLSVPGIDLNMRDSCGQTPLELAESLSQRKFGSIEAKEIASLITMYLEDNYRMFTFAMAMHPRLGSDSPASILLWMMTINKAIGKLVIDR